MLRKTAWLVLLLAVGCLRTPLRADEGPGQIQVRDFFNVVAPDGADPWVVKQPDGRYYATVTTGTDVTLTRSRTISGLGGGERKVVFRPPPQARNLWAPEIHQVGCQWYVYVAADDGDNANHRMFVLENPSADPFEGRFTLKGKIADPGNDRWAIDATVLRVEGRLYLIWSGWEGKENVAQNLYIAPMRNPWTLAGPRALISRPTLPWERRGGPPWINEGPQVLIRDGRVLIVYSAAGSWTDHYCLGMLSARVGGNLLSAASWKKHPSPVFESANGVFGPGHCSFVKSPDDKEDWIVYHAARRGGSGWKRLLRAQPFAWNADGAPIFAGPASPNRAIALPGGEPVRLRIEGESATLTGTARLARHPTCSGGEKVVHVDTGDSSATFPASVGKAGSYLLVIRFGNGIEGDARASHRLTVNDGASRMVTYENNGWDNWSNAFVPVELKAGENRLKFERGDGYAEIDCIDLVPQP
jgi:GH43 family beta-xylosidase